MDSRQQSDIFSMFHSFLQQYWSPDRMGMQGSSLHEMLQTSKDTIGAIVPGFGSKIDQAESFLNNPQGGLGPIGDIFGKMVGG